VLPLPISALKSGSPVLHNPANRNLGRAADLRAVPQRLRQRRQRGRAHQLYEQFAVPTPGKPLFQAAAPPNLNPWTAAKVDALCVNLQRGRSSC
jgi:non-heme chloroperoxidase